MLLHSTLTFKLWTDRETLILYADYSNLSVFTLFPTFNFERLFYIFFDIISVFAKLLLTLKSILEKDDAIDR